MKKKEAEICEFEEDFKNFFVGVLIQVGLPQVDLTNDMRGLKIGLDFSGRVNFVPRAFPWKNGWGGRPTHFLREKPWGRGWGQVWKRMCNWHFFGLK